MHPPCTHPQMDFAGLQPTNATYHDKMAYMRKLKQEHGLK